MLKHLFPFSIKAANANVLLSNGDFMQGGPIFLTSLLRKTREDAIIHFQRLYSQYSTLGFTRPTDRAKAIEGLQRRLASTLSTRDMPVKGCFGVLFDTSGGGLFHRSLLWRRSSKTIKLDKIDQNPSMDKTPTWSWMSYNGPIKFLRIREGIANWQNVQLSTSNLIADVYSLKPPTPTAKLVRPSLEETFLDDSDYKEELLDKCIVIARDKRLSDLPTVHIKVWVMLLRERHFSLGHATSFERVGIAIVLEHRVSESPLYEYMPIV